MQCAYHPDREPVGACVACGRLICIECKAFLGGKIYCTPCADKIFVQGKSEVTKMEKAEASSTRQQPEVIAEPVYAATETMSTASTIGTTSGQGATSVLPDELKGWNWGAFFLLWIWGIGNSVWISLLCLIPIGIVQLVMAFVLGSKGNEWAWQHKKWESIEHFQKTQKTWAKWGVWLFIAGIIISIICIIIALVFAGWAVRFN